jgi:hypothetical protein
MINLQTINTNVKCKLELLYFWLKTIIVPEEANQIR